ncbi:octaprenyl diphosphate synthase [Wohlfahrtiimonas chitiniclastica]|uniref:octaprenyl diphosphate synthase n=1 Tax=Wohlfahrtiimonas chitiniclastica TaxID=400946 RepID=UPI001BCC25B5|nr:octaprenyl diphosphate synthase [Wohlfahrtiimonas chitiniclastica]MBS7814428.1 octaprenyl diphosphate synthase [Wohlfahrtiimonas chitiniclastica]
MSIKNIQALIADDFNQVNEAIMTALSSDVALINELGAYIILSGGKRLRPMITVLCAKAAQYTGDKHISAAALIEFIHTATLLHDDVVDHSDMRRGKETANAIWGNEASVLVGDFLYTRAFQMMVNLDSMRVMRILAEATNRIAEGEVLQLLNIKEPNITEANYFNVIYSKTAKLFEAAAEIAGVMAYETSRQPESQVEAFREYGKYVGTAFQLIDDILDYTATAEEMGKNTGDDLAEGKPTLPLIRAIEVGTPEEAELVRNALLNADVSQLSTILQIIERTESLTYTYQKACEQVDQAIAAIAPIADSPYKEALIGLAKYAIERKF